MTVFTLVLICLVASGGAAVAADAGSPHRMVGADGQPDAAKCGLCHAEDFSLSRSKEETCGLCHARTVHAGAAEHLAASAASVARLLPAKDAGEVVLPLAEDGRMYCGTCHLFHDPAISGETPLAAARVPGATGLAGAVRAARGAQWDEVARRHGAAAPGASFAAESTRALRLPVDDGTLCRHCHGDQP